MAHMDIFNDDAFSLVTMTAAVERMPTVPSFLGSLGLFESEGITTNIASIEQVGQTLQLINTSQRGTAPAMGRTDKRSMRNFNIPRIADSDQVFASEIQGIRAFGTESELETVVQKVAQKQAKMLRKVALTLEYHRLGAIQGILLDADNSVLYNYFTEFGISQPAEIDFDLDNPAPARGALMNLVKSVKRSIIRALGEAAPGIRIIALCGDTFFDQFTVHSEVEKSYINWSDAASLRAGEVFSAFRWGEIDWVNYQGTDDNSTVAIAANQVKFIVQGVPGLFRRINGPGETFETVNTIGRDIYSLMVRDNDRNMWVQPEVYAYPLHVCTRPEVLLRGRNT
jgi:hypothetical protein